MIKWYLYWVAIAMAIAAYTILPDVPRFWFLGVERDPFCIALSGAAFVASLWVYLNYPKKLVAYFGFGAFLNNLLDEIFFNPEVYQWNEYVIAILSIMLWLFKRKIEHGKSNNIKTI